jgi:hypothetical protein
VVAVAVAFMVLGLVLVAIDLALLVNCQVGIQQQNLLLHLHLQQITP